jgi:putative transposase
MKKNKFSQEQIVGFLQPGKPMQNGHIESMNGRIRDECLNREEFRSLAHGPGRRQ